MMKGACGGVSGRVPVRETSVTPRQLTGPIWAVRTPNCRASAVAARKGLPVTTSVIRIAERDEAAVLSLAYFLTPFTVTNRQVHGG